MINADAPVSYATKRSNFRNGGGMFDHEKTSAKDLTRRARTDARLNEAVMEQLASRGYGRLTIEKVATSSGVAKTTIYRRWASKAEMVFEIAIHNSDQTPLPDTGSLVGDVQAISERAVQLVAGKVGRIVLPGLLADMANDDALNQRLQTTFVETARSDIADVIDRATHRGELAPGADLDGFHAALLGIPFAYVHLLGITDVEQLTTNLTKQLLALLTVPSPS